MFNSGNLAYEGGHAVRFYGRAVMDPVPAVQAHLPGTLFKFSGLREDAFHAGNTHFTKGIVKGRRLGGNRPLFYHQGCFFIQIDIGGSFYINTAIVFLCSGLFGILHRKGVLLKLIPLAGAQQDQGSKANPIESFIHA